MIPVLFVLVPTLALGARYAWGQLAIVLLIVAWAAVWLVGAVREGRGSLVWSWSYLVWLGGAALALAQIIPLSPATVNAVSPRIRELLPLWTSETIEPLTAGLGGWQFASLTPGRTGESLAVFLCIAAIWFLALQQIRTFEQIRSLLAIMFGAGVLVALFGLVQWMFWNGRFYWVLDLPGVPTDRHLRGPFTNRNHFAGFLALAVGPGCYWIAELLSDRRTSSSGPRAAARGRWQFPWELRLLGAVAGVAIILATVLLSLSRGGACAAVLAVLTAGAGLAVLLPAARNRLAGLGLLCLFFVGWQVLVQLPEITNRISNLGQETSDATASAGGRLRLWGALLGAATDFPIVGTGFGSHRYVYPLYMTPPADSVFTHAENCYLQLWVEGGLVALNLLVLGMLLVVVWLVRALRSGQGRLQTMAVAIGASLLASALHAAVDFVWYVPAYAVVVVLLAAAAYRLSRLADSSRIGQPSGMVVPRLAGWVALVALPLVAWVGISHFARKTEAELAWFDYLRCLAVTERRSDRNDREDQAQRIELLGRCLSARPDNSEAQFKLGQIYAHQAAASSETERERYRDQARQHFREALRHCPIFADAYLALARLESSAVARSHVAAGYAVQAVRLRPRDPQLCFAAGYELFQQQQPAAALAAWKLAARCGQEWEERVVELVAPHADAHTLMEHLDPSPQALVWAADHCGQSAAQATKQAELLKLARVRLENKPPAKADARDLLLLHHVAKRVGDDSAADRAMDRYVQVRGRDFESLVEQARWYQATGRHEQALHLLERCRAERPDDTTVARLMKELTDSLVRRAPAS